MMTDASVHDIGSARHRRNEKRRTTGGVPSHDARLVELVRENLSAAKQWKLDKKSPLGRSELKRLARNLHMLLNGLAHGEKKDALKLAGFGDGSAETATMYAPNLTIPPDMTTVTDDRFRRLTPNVGAYVRVAEACPPYRDTAIAKLFRGTTLEALLANSGIESSWMRELAVNLRLIADHVATRTALAKLFDQMSDANLCILEGKRHEMAATGWLSVTFHKTDGGPPIADKPYWLLDREDDGAPLGGAALFSPKVELSRNVIKFELEQIVRDEPQLGSIGAGTLLVNTSLFFAILPVAADLGQPASTEPVFLLRPTMHLETPDGIFPINWASPKDGTLRLWWQNPETRELVIYSAKTDLAMWTERVMQTQHLSFEGDDCVDLLVELWRVLPLAAPECEAVLAGPAEVLRFVAPQPSSVIRDRLLLPPGEIEEIDLASIVPSRFAPQGTLASHLQRALAAPSSIIRDLEADAVAYRQAFQVVVDAANSLLVNLEEDVFGNPNK